MPPHPSLLIAGQRINGTGDVISVINPASGSVTATFAGASATDIIDAIEAAERVFEIWRRVSPIERESILRRAAAEVRQDAEIIAQAIVLENGKPFAEARAEALATAEVLDFYAGEARRCYGRVIPSRTPLGRMMTMREPVGVVAAFVPWNFPAINFIRKVAPALAAGCTLVTKPAEETPNTALLIAECLARAGIPPGTLNILYGNPTEISTALINAPVVKKISFTGSTAVGRELARQAGHALKRTTMELGGHAPVIICADADPEKAADMAATAKFRNAGQSCNSASRFYVHRSLHDRFATRFAEKARAIRLGDGMAPETTMGPLSNARRISALERLVADALSCGATLLAGGKAAPGPGYFFEPTVLTEVPTEALILHEEPFGPVAPIVAFDDLDEALAGANNTVFGLAGYIITDHAPSARRLAAEMRTGIVAINAFVAAYPESPFGGLGESGWGHEGGPEGIDPYLQTRFINEA